ncbi:serine/threonine protein kinase [Coniosporium apollinis CBS 100218]|uniref:non-specific serine/threonine protein kinase n=1 Tax=Coniosporium apollinis (strain CBS 100218) TaxID=1168221 RepID=R7YSI0_CONA1|nr:serine/threonine protein kinase [Coniosporium apollinis CBS 100218]EON64865.1 serine/threonine protein kinase [Coniosporium apollinis CBS 100218]
MGTYSPPEKVAALTADWCGRGSHVDFQTDDTVPLSQGKFLGHGVNGGVYQTTCRGVALAWKRRYCRGAIGSRERNEIEVLKRLNHHHIIHLVGTYTHGPFLGLLLWPVAVCDLATFFEDYEYIWRHSLTLADPEEAVKAEAVIDRFHQLGPKESDNKGLVRLLWYRDRLYESFGCLAQAVAYLHQQRVRHKDLKPSNVLLYREGLRVTDFGTSTDFSALTMSLTDNGERGTPKYFAPEVAAYKPNGRAADIFSLGCIFFEMLSLLFGTEPMEAFKALRPEADHSFQANIHLRHQWYALLRIDNARFKHLLAEIELMLAVEPSLRPNAAELVEHLTLIDGFRKDTDTDSSRLFGACCPPAFTSVRSAATAVDDLKMDLDRATEELDQARQNAKLAESDAALLRAQKAKLEQWVRIVLAANPGGDLAGRTAHAEVKPMQATSKSPGTKPTNVEKAEEGHARARREAETEAEEQLGILPPPAFEPPPAVDIASAIASDRSSSQPPPRRRLYNNPVEYSQRTKAKPGVPPPPARIPISPTPGASIPASNMIPVPPLTRDTSNATTRPVPRPPGRWDPPRPRSKWPTSLPDLVTQ